MPLTETKTETLPDTDHVPGEKPNKWHHVNNHRGGKSLRKMMKEVIYPSSRLETNVKIKEHIYLSIGIIPKTYLKYLYLCIHIGIEPSVLS